VCAVLEIAAQLLAFFSCHVVGSSHFSKIAASPQGPHLASLQGTATPDCSDFQFFFNARPIPFFYDQAVEKLSRKSTQYFANFCLLRLRRIHRNRCADELSGPVSAQISASHPCAEA
jgi:hypothetical protein